MLKTLARYLYAINDPSYFLCNCMKIFQKKLKKKELQKYFGSCDTDNTGIRS